MFPFTAYPAMMLLLVAMMAALVESHIIMASPKPYGNPDNSPLTSNNYPCKVTSNPETFYKTEGIIDQNTMVAGESQALSFSGSAVHGGGSCQLAVTSDMQPSASTSWRVILSIESGCPSTDGTAASTFNYTLPADLTPGQYSFAWTWISKLAGQPEYYMNCAPITVTAGSSSKARRETEDVSLLPRADSYPELFVANLDSINSCKTTPSTDVEFPDPGQNVEKKGATPSFSKVSGTGCVPKSQAEGGGPLPIATAGVSGGAATGDTPGSSTNASSAVPPATEQSPNPGSGSPPESQPFGSPTATLAPSGGAAGGALPTTLVTSTAPPRASSVYVSPVTTVEVPSATVTATVTAPTNSSTSASVPSSASEPASTASSTAGPPPSSAATSEPAYSSAPASQSTPQSAPTSAAASATATATATLLPTGGGSPSGPGSPTPTGSTGGPSGKTGACTSEGMFNCIGSQYQQCASGSWTAMKALPGGTACQQGESQNLWARDGAHANSMRRARRGGKMRPRGA